MIYLKKLVIHFLVTGIYVTWNVGNLVTQMGFEKKSKPINIHIGRLASKSATLNMYEKKPVIKH